MGVRKASSPLTPVNMCTFHCANIAEGKSAPESREKTINEQSSFARELAVDNMKSKLGRGSLNASNEMNKDGSTMDLKETYAKQKEDIPTFVDSIDEAVCLDDLDEDFDEADRRSSFMFTKNVFGQPSVALFILSKAQIYKPSVLRPLGSVSFFSMETSYIAPAFSTPIYTTSFETGKSLYTVGLGTPVWPSLIAYLRRALSRKVELENIEIPCAQGNFAVEELTQTDEVYNVEETTFADEAACSDDIVHDIAEATPTEDTACAEVPGITCSDAILSVEIAISAEKVFDEIVGAEQDDVTKETTSGQVSIYMDEAVCDHDVVDASIEEVCEEVNCVDESFRVEEAGCDEEVTSCEILEETSAVIEEVGSEEAVAIEEAVVVQEPLPIEVIAAVEEVASLEDVAHIEAEASTATAAVTEEAAIEVTVIEEPVTLEEPVTNEELVADDKIEPAVKTSCVEHPGHDGAEILPDEPESTCHSELEGARFEVLPLGEQQVFISTPESDTSSETSDSETVVNEDNDITENISEDSEPSPNIDSLLEKSFGRLSSNWADDSDDEERFDTAPKTPTPAPSEELKIAASDEVAEGKSTKDDKEDGYTTDCSADRSFEQLSAGWADKSREGDSESISSSSSDCVDVKILPDEETKEIADGSAEDEGSHDGDLEIQQDAAVDIIKETQTVSDAETEATIQEIDSGAAAVEDLQEVEEMKSNIDRLLSDNFKPHSSWADDDEDEDFAPLGTAAEGKSPAVALPSLTLTEAPSVSTIDPPILTLAPATPTVAPPILTLAPPTPTVTENPTISGPDEKSKLKETDAKFTFNPKATEFIPTGKTFVFNPLAAEFKPSAVHTTVEPEPATFDSTGAHFTLDLQPIETKSSNSSGLLEVPAVCPPSPCHGRNMSTQERDEIIRTYFISYNGGRPPIEVFPGDEDCPVPPVALNIIPPEEQTLNDVLKLVPAQVDRSGQFLFAAEKWHGRFTDDELVRAKEYIDGRRFDRLLFHLYSNNECLPTCDGCTCATCKRYEHFSLARIYDSERARAEASEKKARKSSGDPSNADETEDSDDESDDSEESDDRNDETNESGESSEANGISDESNGSQKKEKKKKPKLHKITLYSRNTRFDKKWRQGYDYTWFTDRAWNDESKADYWERMCREFEMDDEAVKDCNCEMCQIHYRWLTQEHEQGENQFGRFKVPYHVLGPYREW